MDRRGYRDEPGVSRFLIFCNGGTGLDGGSGVVAEEEEEGNLATTTRVELCLGFFNLEVDI